MDVYAGFSHDLLKSNELNHQAVSALSSGQLVRRYGDGRLELRLVALPLVELTLASLASNLEVSGYEAISPIFTAIFSASGAPSKMATCFPSVDTTPLPSGKDAVHCTSSCSPTPKSFCSRSTSNADHASMLAELDPFPSPPRYASRPLSAPSSSAPSNSRSSELC